MPHTPSPSKCSTLTLEGTRFLAMTIFVKRTWASSDCEICMLGRDLCHRCYMYITVALRHLPRQALAPGGLLACRVCCCRAHAVLWRSSARSSWLWQHSRSGFGHPLTVRFVGRAKRLSIGLTSTLQRGLERSWAVTSVYARTRELFGWRVRTTSR